MYMRNSKYANIWSDNEPYVTAGNKTNVEYESNDNEDEADMLYLNSIYNLEHQQVSHSGSNEIDDEETKHTQLQTQRTIVSKTSKTATSKKKLASPGKIRKIKLTKNRKSIKAFKIKRKLKCRSKRKSRVSISNSPATPKFNSKKITLKASNYNINFDGRHRVSRSKTTIQQADKLRETSKNSENSSERTLTAKVYGLTNQKSNKFVPLKRDLPESRSVMASTPTYMQRRTIDFKPKSKIEKYKNVFPLVSREQTPKFRNPKFQPLGNEILFGTNP